MSRKGYYVDGQFIARGSEEDRQARADLRGGERPSRTQQKQASEALQDLGESLMALGPDTLARLPLGDRLRAAVLEARRLTSTGALRRQRQFIGKLMRQQDPGVLDAIQQAINAPGLRPPAPAPAPAKPWRGGLPLVVHPEEAAGPVARLVGEAACLEDGCLRLAWSLHGDLSALRLPAPAAADRADGLWRHTCFEAFIGTAGGPAYSEWNFSPSGQWAAYGFSAYRRGMTPLPLAAPPEIKWRRTPDQLRLDVALPLAALGDPPPADLRIGLSAVLEDQSGLTSHWSLDHPGPRPDFHASAGFLLQAGSGAP